MADIAGIERRRGKQKEKTFQDLKRGNIPSKDLLSMPLRAKEITGKEGNYTQQYNKTKYKFMLDAPFEVHNKCCSVMKKGPAHKYAHESGRKPMTAEMADESRNRKRVWMKYGCNGFDMKEPKSTPMAFWTKQDVLQYIKENNLNICSVYGDIVIDYEKENQCEGQMDLFEMEHPLKTTGCDRTGCMFCGYGCHLEKPGEGRFERMKETHPAQWSWIMKKWEEGGLGYRDIINWINEHGNMDIRTGDETE